jgi:hypothetical protein
MPGRAVLAGALALAGGVLAVVGSLLVWAEVSAGPFTQQAKGIDGWEGKAAIVSGVVMVAAGIRVLAGSHQAMARLRPSAAIGGLVALGVGLSTTLTIRDQLIDTVAREIPRADVERALDSGLLELTIGIGLYLVIAGGVQGVVAALVAPGSRDEPIATSGSGLRGWSSLGDGADGTPPTPPSMPDTPAPPSGRVPDEGGEPRG